MLVKHIKKQKPDHC